MHRGSRIDQCFVFFLIFDLVDFWLVFFFFHQNAIDLNADHDPLDGGRQFTTFYCKGMGAGVALIGHDCDDNAETLFQSPQMTALLVENVERDFRTCPHSQIMRGGAEQMFFHRAQDVQGYRGHGTHKADTRAMRADDGGALKHTGANTLAGHFEQAKRRNTADLNAGAVVFQRVLHPAFDRTIIAVFLHVDEIDHDKPGQIAQPQLACNLVGCFQIGFQRRVFDIVLTRGAARIDVNGHQRFGLVDDQVATRFQCDLIGEHRIQLRLDAVTGKQGLRIAIGFDVAGMARHEHAHKVLGIFVGGLACDNHLVDVFVVEITDRTFDQRPFFINQRSSG